MRRRRKKHLSLHSRYAGACKRSEWALEHGPTGIPFGHFVHDQLANGLAFRVLTVIDNWSRESILLEVGFRLTAQSVIDALNLVSKSRKLPASITVDHGAEFTSLVMDDWAHINRVTLTFTRLEKPTDNGLCESFNGRLRDECLNVTMQEAKRIIEAWRCEITNGNPCETIKIGLMAP